MTEPQLRIGLTLHDGTYSGSVSRMNFSTARTNAATAPISPPASGTHGSSRGYGDGGVLGVDVAGTGHVAGDEGHPAGVLLAQLLDGRVDRAADLALEVEELDEHRCALRRLTEDVAVLAHHRRAATATAAAAVAVGGPRGRGLTVAGPVERQQHDHRRDEARDLPEAGAAE